MPRRMRDFILAVLVVAAAVLVVIAEAYPVPQQRLSGLGLLCVLALVAGNMTFDLPMAASVSLGFAMTFAAIVYGGPLAGAIVGLIGAVSLQELRDRKPPLLILGNGAQLALAGALAGVVHEALLATSDSLLRSVGAPLLAATIFFAVNGALVTTGVSLKTGMSARETARVLGLTSYWVSLVVLALLGLVLSELLLLRSWIGLVLLVLPFMAARRTFRVSVELSEAYTSTVRSLVTAVEAKDPYTRGHSERVAEYARQLAETMRLPAEDVELVERAGLLHDVGKIGIPIDTLASPSQLSSEEVRLIRQHPDVGSRLVGDVEFLSDTVKVIRHHHERIDGAGYPDGLVGEEIPRLARLLAVADAYDAMTSTRAYRLAMTEPAALKELERVAGAQLDSSIVSMFIALRLDGAERRSP